MKPDACKVWPFKVLSEAKYGDPNKAAYTYRGYHLCVEYVCSEYVTGTDLVSYYRKGAELSRSRQVQHNTTKTGLVPSMDR